MGHADLGALDAIDRALDELRVLCAGGQTLGSRSTVIVMIVLAFSARLRSCKESRRRSGSRAGRHEPAAGHRPYLRAWASAFAPLRSGHGAVSPSLSRRFAREAAMLLSFLKVYRIRSQNQNVPRWIDPRGACLKLFFITALASADALDPAQVVRDGRAAFQAALVRQCGARFGLSAARRLSR